MSTTPINPNRPNSFELFRRVITRDIAELRARAGVLMKAERKDHTLQATALVTESVRRILAAASPIEFQSEEHVKGCILQAMRRVLTDSGRSKSRRSRERRFSDLCADGGLDTTEDQVEDSRSVQPEQRLENLEQLQAGLGMATPRELEVLMSKAVACMCAREIACQYGVSEKAIERTLTRVRKRLACRHEAETENARQ